MSIFSDTGSGASTGALFGGIGAPVGALVGLGAGLLGHSAEKQKQQAEAQIRAAEIQASPWTKMAPQQAITFAAPAVGSAIGGIGAGLGVAQSLAKANAPSPWANMASYNQSNALQNLGSAGQIDPNGMNAMMIDNQKMPNLYGA